MQFSKGMATHKIFRLYVMCIQSFAMKQRID
jgi:hypothetical protein